MCPNIWWLPQPGLQSAIDVLATRGLEIESLPDDPWLRAAQFLARRGPAAQRCKVWKWEGGVVVEADYHLTWPWRWKVEARLYDEICQTFEIHFERFL